MCVLSMACVADLRWPPLLMVSQDGDKSLTRLAAANVQPGCGDPFVSTDTSSATGNFHGVSSLNIVVFAMSEIPEGGPAPWLCLQLRI